MRLFRLVVGFAAIAGVPACSYQATPNVMPAVNLYSSYDDKVPGKFLLTVNASEAVLRREVRPSSYVCSAHTFPIDAASSVSQSITRTLENVFAEIEVVPAVPSYENLRQAGAVGHILVQADDFQPRLSCSAAFFQSHCTGHADLSLGITVTSPSGKLMATSVGATRSADSDAGAACEGGANALASAAGSAMKEAMERMAERLTNSPRIREAAGGGRAPSVRPASLPVSAADARHVACRVNGVIALMAVEADCRKSGGKVLD